MGEVSDTILDELISALCELRECRRTIPVRPRALRAEQAARAAAEARVAELEKWDEHATEWEFDGGRGTISGGAAYAYDMIAGLVTDIDNSEAFHANALDSHGQFVNLGTDHPTRDAALAAYEAWRKGEGTDYA